MSVARNVVFSPSLAPGGGATEMAISVGLSQKAKTVQGVEGWPFQAVADAMEVIPRTLVQNAGGNAIRVLTELRVRLSLNISLLILFLPCSPLPAGLHVKSAWADWTGLVLILMNKPLPREGRATLVAGRGNEARPGADCPARLIDSPAPPVPLVRLLPRGGTVGVVTDVVLVFIIGETCEWWTFLGDQWGDWQN